MLYFIISAIILGAILTIEYTFIADDRQRHQGCNRLLGIFPRDHVQPTSGQYYGDGIGYGKIVGGVVDGIGRKHCDVVVNCVRCRKKYTLVKVHLNE